jgi:hypothetical protein
MATTTNYGWTTPDDTDLVKDGAAAIRTLGSSVDTTTKNLNPETTLGDIAYRSSTANTNTRLPIGSTGQVLTVAAGVPSWATVAASGFTLITNSSFSAVSSHSINSCFTSTYTNYKIIVNLTAASTGMDINFRLRASGTDTSANYNTLRLAGASGGGVFADLNNNGTDDFFKWNTDGTDAQNVFCEMEVYSPQKATKTSINGMFANRSGGGEYYILPNWAMQTSTTQFDGITMLASAGNFTGSIKVYGFGE